MNKKDFYNGIYIGEKPIMAGINFGWCQIKSKEEKQEESRRKITKEDLDKAFNMMREQKIDVTSNTRSLEEYLSNLLRKN